MRNRRLPYSFAMTATGGRLPYRWRVTAGATQRPGGRRGAGRRRPDGPLVRYGGRDRCARRDRDRRPVPACRRAGAGRAGDVAAGAADSSAAGNDGAGNLRYAEWAWHRPAGGGRADEDG